METMVMTDEMSMDELLAENNNNSNQGEVVDGTVVGHVDNHVLVNVGLKQEAQVSVKEFGANIPVVGTIIPVLILRMSGPEGRPVVSYRQARERKNWDKIASAHKNNTPLPGKILARIKGGVQVDIGLDAFMPASQIDDKPVSKFEEWIGKTVDVLVLEMDKSKGNVLVSRRKILENEKAVKRVATLQKIEVGQVLEGRVTGLTNFGAFVDVGGVEGLVHVSDLAWQRVDNPKTIVKVGDVFPVKVLKFDTTTQKISLGRKQLMTHPWDGIEKKFPAGTVINGKVTSLAPFGAFVQIEPGVEGLIHMSELSWTDRAKNPKDVLKVGQAVEARIIGIDRANEKISLSLKRTGESPWDGIEKKYPVGSQIDVEVTHLAKFGAFVKIADGIEALLKVHDLSWSEKIQNPSQVLKVGDKIKVAVLEINLKEEKISVGLKQLQADPLKKYKVGQAVTGTVTNVTNFGLFVKLDSGIEGLIRSNETFLRRSIFSDAEPREDRARGPQPDQPLFKVGDTVTAAVFKIDKKERKLELSIRQYESREEKELLKKYTGSKQLPTLGTTTGWDALPDIDEKPSTSNK
jgi:small subunit ribosomal protein S1